MLALIYTSVAVDELCKGGKQYVAAKTSCAQYYHCDVNGVATLVKCPLGLHFTETKQGCDFVENVTDCPQCADIGSNRYAASLESCRQYYYCDPKGYAILKSCPEGFYFTSARQGCDFPINVHDCPLA